MKNASILTTLIFGTARLVLFIVLSVLAAKDKAWLLFALWVVLAVLAFALAITQLCFLGVNKKYFFYFIPSVLFVSIVGGITYAIWKVDPTHNPGYVPQAEKHEQALDSVLGISEEE